MATAWSRLRSQLGWRHVRTFAYLYSACYVLNRQVGELIVCHGDSMIPALHSGDLVLTERLSVRRGNVRVGDIVCALNPTDPSVLLCKRIAAMPHEKINVEQEYEYPLARVPAGHCFLTGDNVAVSQDSRHIGPVPLGLVQVRVVARLWPPSRTGWISTHPFNDDKS